MRDPDLQRLLDAMDAMVGWADQRGGQLAIDAELERISLRLECIARRLGDAAQESAYLRFLRRSLAAAPAVRLQQEENSWSRGDTALAASA